MSPKPEPMTFAEHRDQTAADCDQAAQFIADLAAQVRQGDLFAFERFWWKGGTEEGDAKINAIRELLCLRYFHRQEATK